MERRDFLQKSAFGLLTAQAQPSSSGRIDIVNAADFGTAGDNSKDDTAALQGAIDYALAQGKPCFIPSGVYRITAPLVVGDPDSKTLYQGFCLFGTGKSVGGTGGTLIRLVSSGHPAILKMEKNAWRRCEIRDLGLICDSQGGADYGVLFNSTEFSNHSVKNIVVAKVKTAFGILKGTGANGEFILFENCNGTNVDMFFYSNAGQAYVQSFFHCTCTLNRGGTYFNLDFSTGGGGVHVTDFNATGGIDGTGISNTTLFSGAGNSSIVNFFGGRVENLTQLYSAQGGSAGNRVSIFICGMQFTIDSVPTAADLTKPLFVDIAMMAVIVTVQSCVFYSGNGSATIDIGAKAAWSYILFKGCDFQGLSRPPYVTEHWSDQYCQVEFEDCKTSTLTAPGQGPGVPLPFDRHNGRFIGVIGRRTPFSTYARLQSGRPQNYLVRPEFALAGGHAVSADRPWVHYGATKSIGLSDWNGENPPERASPWARSVVISPASGLYQDIVGIDLSAAHFALSINGHDVIPVYYQAAVTFFGGGSTNFKMELVDSVSGAVYDGRYFIGGNNSPQEIGIVTLGSYINRQSATSHPRLKIENLDPQHRLEIHFAWQKVVAEENAAYAPSSLSAQSFSDDWDGTIETLRTIGRLAIPYLPDAYGKFAHRALHDLQSERYQSADTGREQAWQAGQWWDRPLQTIAAAPPDSGRWPYLSQVWNSAAAAGGIPGWIQVTPGELTASLIWTPQTEFAAGIRVYNGSRVYDCVQTGTSAADGPTGDGASIEDGTVKWRYAGRLAPAACLQAWTPGKLYNVLGTQIVNQGNVYELVAVGTSGAANGPNGIRAHISDNLAAWKFVGHVAAFKAMAKLEA